MLERQEAHRRRIARALHAETGQMLAALRLNLASPELKFRTDAGGRLLDETRALLDELIARLRELTSELWPALLDDLGLEQAANWHVGHAAASSGMRSEFRAEGNDLDVAGETARAAFEVIREATANASRHADADWIGVTLRRHGESLSVEVRDDGRGFDADGRAPHWRRGNGGLGYAADRVELLGGRLTVEASPGSGTVVHATLPMDP